MLAYFIFPAIAFIFIPPFNRNRFVRFHSFQCLLTVAVLIVLQVALDCFARSYRGHVGLFHFPCNRIYLHPALQPQSLREVSQFSVSAHGRCVDRAASCTRLFCPILSRACWLISFSLQSHLSSSRPSTAIAS